jgi:hypothetical protein
MSDILNIFINNEKSVNIEKKIKKKQHNYKRLLQYDYKQLLQHNINNNLINIITNYIPIIKPYLSELILVTRNIKIFCDHNDPIYGRFRYGNQTPIDIYLKKLKSN